MKRIIALIAALILTSATVNGTAALLGGEFVAATGTAVTEAFGVSVIEAPTSDLTMTGPAADAFAAAQTIPGRIASAPSSCCSSCHR